MSAAQITLCRSLEDISAQLGDSQQVYVIMEDPEDEKVDPVLGREVGISSLAMISHSGGNSDALANPRGPPGTSPLGVISFILMQFPLKIFSAQT